jgi:hypothetical protein
MIGPAGTSHVGGAAVWLAARRHRGLLIAQRDVVRRGDVVSLDSAKSFAKTLASLPKKLERVGECALRSGALQISFVLFEEVGLEGRSHFVDRLERVVDGQLPSVVVNHTASIPRSRLRLPALDA